MLPVASCLPSGEKLTAPMPSSCAGHAKSLSPDVIASMTPEQRDLFAIESHVAYYDYKTDQIIRRSQPENGHRPTRAKK